MPHVGYRSHDRAAIEALYELEYLPDEPWAAAVVVRALCAPDPEMRELAIAVAATGRADTWRVILWLHSTIEPMPWLARFSALACTP